MFVSVQVQVGLMRPAVLPAASSLSSWLGQIIGGGGGGDSEGDGGEPLALAGDNLAELWVNFLLHESESSTAPSSPPPPPPPSAPPAPVLAIPPYVLPDPTAGADTTATAAALKSGPGSFRLAPQSPVFVQQQPQQQQPASSLTMSGTMSGSRISS